MSNTIIIIGAGMGGLAAGIYGQANGYRTRIFEAHAISGGQCTAWKRNGYTFDGCLHHLMGCRPGTRLYGLWEELGAMPRPLVPTRECVSAVSPDGRYFHDYYDLERLEDHLLALAPRDGQAVRGYVRGLRACARHSLMEAALSGSPLGLLTAAPLLPTLLPLVRHSMSSYARRFTDPLLRRAFPLLEYSMPDSPFMVHLMKHGDGTAGGIAWPAGGAAAFAASIEKRYRELGGEVRHRARVERILVEDDRAVGVRLADGSEHRADIVISNANGRRTIRDLLENRYTDERIRGWCAEPADETLFAVNVFLGVNRDLAQAPSSLVVLLERPVTLAGHTADSLELQTYGFDPSMAPAGKGVIKVELPSRWSLWKALSADRERYRQEKERVAEQVRDLLEPVFPGLRAQTEVVDVSTLVTWERYIGGTHGIGVYPNKKPDILGSATGRGLELTLPGLAGFWFAGSWATAAGALFANAMSGRTVIRRICKEDGKRFTAPPRAS